MNYEYDERDLCVDYVNTSKLSVRGRLGLGILKEASANVSANESLELKIVFGKVMKNETELETFAEALKVCFYDLGNNYWLCSRWGFTARETPEKHLGQ